ncbi:Peptidase_S8 domain-containing protein/PA domain-containing protein/Inhibitor_I9 domain-containing protein, partial [Cephalotus follicularis]
VYLGAHTHGPGPTEIDLNRVTDSHYQLLGSYLGSNEKAQEQIFYSYTRHINGFAAFLEEEEAVEIAKNPNVVSVFLNKGKKLHTTRSWDFLGVEKDEGSSSSIWRNARFGEDVIIANLDTGVWPESKSFSDEGMGPVPSKWQGTCQDDVRKKFPCNRKLIGAKYFNKGYAAFVGHLDSSYQTTRDIMGHGSHTLSTAAGGFVPGANVLGHGNGTAKGGSPKARVAAYKVCWPPVGDYECFDADILAGFDAAISDGVDILSVSLGGDPVDFFEDGISIGAFHAVKKGIVVVTSAGNNGPVAGSVSNVSPWMFTVGASKIDRTFTNYVALGNNHPSKPAHLKGESLSSGNLPSKKFYPLVDGPTAKLANASIDKARLCAAGTLDPKKVKGKILLCFRGETARLDKGWQAAQAGAVGMILGNDVANGNELVADPHFLPASHLTYEDGETVFEYVHSTKAPMAYMTNVETIVGTELAPVMAAFSSRGPNLIEPTILKPDITAPGMDIIAAFSEAVAPSDLVYDKRRIPFNIMSGTSMSCPHVSGIVGLLKTLHPRWSPAAIKSAIMTTARTQGNNMRPMMDSNNRKATSFAYGAGHVRPNRAMDPGLVYDLTVDDYLNFLCAHGYNKSQINLFSGKPYVCPKSFILENFNYPSITIPGFNRTATVSRTVKNVGSPGTYVASIKAPKGIVVSVSPASLKFEKIGEEKTFDVIFRADSRFKSDSDFVFGHLLWSDGKHYVRSPLVVKHNK